MAGSEYEDFIVGHSAQLSAGVIPKSLWPRLYEKVRGEVFDAGSIFAFCLDEDAPVSQQFSLQTTSAVPAFSDIYLIDHLWTFESPTEALTQLRHLPALCSRVRELLELQEPEGQDTGIDAAAVAKRLWVLTGSYSFNGQSFYYVMDEVGSRLTPAPLDEAGFHITFFVDESTGRAYNVFWPIRDVQDGESGTCFGLETGRRKLAALIDVLSADNEWSPVIPELRTSLLEVDYTVEGIAALLGLPVDAIGLPAHSLSGGPAQAAAAAALPHDESNRLADLVRFFLLNLPISQSRLEQLLSEAVLGMMRHHGLVYCINLDVVGKGDELVWVSLVQLTPVVNNIILATDFFQLAGATIGFDPVMYVGIDSLGLVAALPPTFPHQSNVLDLCCGCGIQGITALSSWARNVTFVDINPRAVSFASFNLFLNGIEEDRWLVVTGDLYDALEDEAEQFDVILANPPYIPSGKGAVANLEVFGDGGADGDSIIQQIVAGAPVHLTAQGFVAIVSNLVNIDNYPEKLELWWTSGERKLGCTTLVLHGIVWDTRTYAQLVVGTGDFEDVLLEPYLTALLDNGVRNVVNGLVFLQAQKDVVFTCSVELTAQQLWQELITGGLVRDELQARLVRMLTT